MMESRIHRSTREARILAQRTLQLIPVLVELLRPSVSRGDVVRAICAAVADVEGYTGMAYQLGGSVVTKTGLSTTHFLRRTLLAAVRPNLAAWTPCVEVTHARSQQWMAVRSAARSWSSIGGTRLGELAQHSEVTQRKFQRISARHHMQCRVRQTALEQSRVG